MNAALYSASELPVLRDCQTDLIDRVSARFREGWMRVLIQAACGFGKTHCSSEMIRRAVARSKKVVFIAHRRRLIQQKSQRLDLFGVPHGIIMSGHQVERGVPVQVTSRDTLLSRSVRSDRLELPPADLVIVDEAHQLGDEYQELIGMWPHAYLLGMTATPADPKGRGLHPLYQVLECAVPTSQLIREGYLVPVRCFGPPGARKGKQQKGLVGDPVKQWKLHAEGRPTVLFASKVESSWAAMNAFLRAGITAEHIDADTPDDTREEVFARVRSGKTKVLTNVGVCVEGVDLPELSCCILLRAASSYIFYAQAVGRGMRPAPGKKDCILLDHAGAVQRHGFPDEDVEWSLDPSQRVEERIRKDKKAGKRLSVLCCPACGHFFSEGSICPSCNRRMPRPREKANTAGMLVELTQGDIFAGKGAVLHEAKVRHWYVCLRTMAWTGRTISAARAMYKKRYNEWPGVGFPHNPPPQDGARYVSELYPFLVAKAKDLFNQV